MVGTHTRELSPVKQRRALIVDDDPVSAFALAAALPRGLVIDRACDGQEALERFAVELPDLVFMDVDLPLLDGLEVTARMRALARDHLVPIILLTNHHDERLLARGFAAGADDFLLKPVSRAVVQSKIAALLRSRELYGRLQRQHDALAKVTERTEAEYATARVVLDNILGRGCLDAPFIRRLLSPIALLNGDMALAAATPSGGLRWMLGDFTGHGLGAALGTIPTATTFYNVTAGGASLRETAQALNSQLRQILPREIFCAAALLELDVSARTLTLWNAGLPAVYVVRPGAGVSARVASGHLPLGIRPVLTSHFRTEEVHVEPGDQVLVYSDGVIETPDEHGYMYGSERLEALLARVAPGAHVSAEVTRELAAHRGAAAAADDTSLVEVEVPETLASLLPVGESNPGGRALFRGSWRFEAAELRGLDLGELCERITAAALHAGERSDDLRTVLGELLANAVDHGILLLDSTMRDSAAGVARYYELREQRLAALQRGWMAVTIEVLPSPEVLVVTVADSGPGFAPGEVAAPGRYSGRGLPLARALCAELRHSGRGNQVEAVLELSARQERCTA